VIPGALPSCLKVCFRFEDYPFAKKRRWILKILLQPNDLFAWNGVIAFIAIEFDALAHGI
jgi:hypothetical protein